MAATHIDDIPNIVSTLRNNFLKGKTTNEWRRHQLEQIKLMLINEKEEVTHFFSFGC